ncbi:hypothetical protein QP246_02495 [Aerococcus urinae]|uniref:hypothetical protein n=1 Tax=Aerococcus urinae TaxID=1376 RepID=UPI002550AC34|nr:hypothetical protein [Aerococcus urinae]MDK6688327.1 hypothetical protein [Aerococcus urinae]
MLIGWFDMTYQEAGKVTLSEYGVYRTAHQVQLQERDEALHMQAYLNQIVQATRKTGKSSYEPEYKHFEDFYDSRKRFGQIFDPDFDYKNERERRESYIAGLNEFINREEGING